ncbi:MAG: hypothetical protein WAV41_01520 [Microgenomates group bacterium]
MKNIDLKMVKMAASYLNAVDRARLPLSKTGFEAFVDEVCEEAVYQVSIDGATRENKRNGVEDLFAISLLEESLPNDFPILKR